MLVDVPCGLDPWKQGGRDGDDDGDDDDDDGDDRSSCVLNLTLD